MVDYAETKPKNRSYFAIRFRIPKDVWMSAILAVAAYAATMSIGYILYK